MGMRAVVIGGGLGGATAALALAEIGIQVEVYEVAPRSTEDTGWVTLGPAGMTGLDQVGVADDIEAVGFPVLSVRSIDTLTGDTNGFPRREPGHRWPSTHVYRRDLLRILRDRLDATGVRCHYDNTPTIADLDGDLIVGADGARSAIRRSIGNLAEPSYTGQVIRYGHHPHPAPDLPTNVFHGWRHAHGVVGYVADSRDGSFWFSRHDSDSPTDVIDQPTALTPLRTTPVQALLDSSWVSRPIALYEVTPEGNWHRDHTVIIGDAAHAVSTAAGRGATSTIEDSIILAKHIREQAYRIPDALESFTFQRRSVARAAYRRTPGKAPRAATAEELDLSGRDVARSANAEQ
jgi:2-polyprenyl-6-methoxyphenol hydroxylase-like FAD-dependent oxidoreductase